MEAGEKLWKIQLISCSGSLNDIATFKKVLDCSLNEANVYRQSKQAIVIKGFLSQEEANKIKSTLAEQNIIVEILPHTNEDYISLESALKQEKEAYNQLKQDVDTLEQKYKEEINALRSERDTCINDTEVLQAKYQLLKDQHDQLERKNRKDVSDYNALLGKYKDLRAENERIIEKNNKVVDEYNALLAKYKELFAIAEKLEASAGSNSVSQSSAQSGKDPIVSVAFNFKIRGFFGWSRKRGIVTMRKSEYNALLRGSDRNRKNYVINHAQSFNLGAVEVTNVESLDQVSVELAD